jgi:RNA-directed DNA polymerase
LLSKYINTFYNLASWQKKEQKFNCVSREIERSELTKARKKMKRYGKLFDKIVHKQNILTAHNNAKKGKSKYAQVCYFQNNIPKCVDNIHTILKNKTYRVSSYIKESRIERGKHRVIYKLPYINDRVIQHALLQVIQPILEETYIKDTYQSIKGRGVHKAKKRIQTFLKDKPNTKYCLKIDIKKFYPSVNNNILKQLIRKKIKCNDTLWLIDEIIDSTNGLPIGNFTSQTFGNYYLSYFDHFIKEDLKVKYYIRYADDMIFFSNSKKELHNIFNDVKKYLSQKLDLEIKQNYQIFPTYTRGLDYLGFRFFKGYTLLRKSIKKNLLKVILKINSGGGRLKEFQSFISYWGWLKATDSYNFLRSIFTKQFKQSFDYIAKLYRIKNPIRSIYIKPKQNINVYGNYQPNLLDFI